MREQMLLIDETSQGQINNAFHCFFSLCFAWTWRKTVRLTANLNWDLLIEFAWVTVTHANSIERRQLATQNMMAGCNDHFAAANLLPVYGIKCYKVSKSTQKNRFSICKLEQCFSTVSERSTKKFIAFLSCCAYLCWQLCNL